MESYGIKILAHGVVLHSDRRVRVWGEDGVLQAVKASSSGGRRDRVRGFSLASQRNLAMVAANVGGVFRSLLTLTYHGLTVEGEPEDARNLRIAHRAKRDLNRFLSAMRRVLGRYLWVMEFQTRGVVHFHALAEHTVTQERASVAWCRATGELGDQLAARHAVRVDDVRDQMAARNYLGRYLGKVEQKALPPGVAMAGRWWGRSRGLALVVLDEVLSCEADCDVPVPAGVRTVRTLKRWLSRQLGWKFRGGSFVSWGDQLTGRLAVAARELREFYGLAQPWGVAESDGGAR